MITSTVPTYVSECSPARSRGRAVAIQMSLVIVSPWQTKDHEHRITGYSSGRLRPTGSTTDALGTCQAR